MSERHTQMMCNRTKRDRRDSEIKRPGECRKCDKAREKRKTIGAYQSPANNIKYELYELQNAIFVL